MDDIEYEPECTQLYDQAGKVIWAAIEQSKLMHKNGKGDEFTNRQIILLGIHAGAKVVANMADAELNIDDQLKEILG